MPLNYGTLKTRILADGHRPNLGDAKAAEFVAFAEGVIDRELRSVYQIERINLVETDRIDGGIYSLPADFLAIAEKSPSSNHTILSDREIEFDVTPAEDAEIRLDYFARPARFTDDNDTNTILTLHESIYVDAGLAALHTYIEDLVLAGEAAVRAQDVIDTLNDQARRMLSSGKKSTRDCYNFRRLGSAY